MKTTLGLDWRKPMKAKIRRVNARRHPLERAYIETLAEGMKPSLLFRDDPLTMGSSLYWIRVTATAEAALKVIEADCPMAGQCLRLIWDMRNRFPRAFVASGLADRIKFEVGE